MARRAGEGYAAVVVAIVCGMGCALLLITAPTQNRRAEMQSTASKEVAASITRELFSRQVKPGWQHQHQHQLLVAMSSGHIAAPLAHVRTSGMMLADDAGEDGDSQDDEYARFVWRKERLGKDWGVNVDTWLDPGLLDNIDYRDRPYTAGHHPSDENITNTTTEFFADDWPKWNETTNKTWINDDDFRWNSPYDYVGARPLEVDHHPLVEHHHVKFLPGVNINSNPFCGQNLDGSPIDCGDSEWMARQFFV